MSVFQGLYILLFIFLIGTKGRKTRNMEKRLGILEQKFGLQTYENTLMQAEINDLKNIVTDIVANISHFITDAGESLIDEDIELDVSAEAGTTATEIGKTAKEIGTTAKEIGTTARPDTTSKAICDNTCVKENAEMASLKQNLTRVAETTKLLMHAFKDEKKERTKRNAELETLRKSEFTNKIQLNLLKESLERAQKDFQKLKDTYKDEKDEMMMDMVNLQTLQKEMEKASVKLKKENDENENEITKISTKLDRMTDSMEIKYNLIAENIKEIGTDFKSKHVSFSARLAGSVTNLGAWQTLVFDSIIHNEGNAYSPKTGLFTAPVNGVYAFYTHILARQRPLEMCLQHNGTTKLWLYVSGITHGADSNFIVLHLNKGDEIKVVKHGPYGSAPFYVHNVWTTFSGYMLYQL